MRTKNVKNYKKKALPFFKPGADLGFGQEGAQLLSPKVADVAKWSHASVVSNVRLGSKPLSGPWKWGHISTGPRPPPPRIRTR